MKIKIYPSIGDCYGVELPFNNSETNELYEWTEEKIEEWIEDNLKFVETWELIK